MIPSFISIETLKLCALCIHDCLSMYQLLKDNRINSCHLFFSWFYPEGIRCVFIIIPSFELLVLKMAFIITYSMHELLLLAMAEGYEFEKELFKIVSTLFSFLIISLFQLFLKHVQKTGSSHHKFLMLKISFISNPSNFINFSKMSFLLVNYLLHA